MFGNAIEVFTETVLLILHALFEEPRFDARVACDAPVCGGELMDEIGLGLGLRTEMVEIIGELRLVFASGLVEEDDGAGGESMGDGVERGGLFTGRGSWASGFCAVGAGGGDFAGGGRHGFSVRV